MAEILFATNRVQLQSASAQLPQFGDIALPQQADSLWCGNATVENIDLTNPDIGIVSKIDGLTQGGFAPAQLDALAQSSNDILLFIHGAENSFTDAVTRAAYNQAWIAATAGKPIDVIAFTWPAREYPNLVNIFEDYSDYRHDQLEADASAYHFGLLLTQLYALKPRLGARRLNLLCHSMGNRMLGGGIEAWFRGGHAPAALFDQVILAAADETSTTFLGTTGKRLSRLAQVAGNIAVYFNDNDILMELSDLVNPFRPLGKEGASGQSNTHIYPTETYQFVDCTNVSDYVGLKTFDLSHQYYRQSPAVRADIAALLAGQVPQRYYYDASGNVYWLVMPPILGVPTV